MSFFASHYGIYFRLIDCLLRLGDNASALEYLERLKSRNLADLLMGRDYGPRNATEQAIDEYKSLRLRMRALSLRVEREGYPSGWIQEYVALIKEYDQVVGCLRERKPDFDPDQTGTISFREIRELISDEQTALIEIFPMPDKTVVFVVVHDQDIRKTTVILGDYTQEELDQDLHGVRQANQLEATMAKLYAKLFGTDEDLFGWNKKTHFDSILRPTLDPSSRHVHS